MFKSFIKTFEFLNKMFNLHQCVSGDQVKNLVFLKNLLRRDWRIVMGSLCIQNTEIDVLVHKLDVSKESTRIYQSGQQIKCISLYFETFERNKLCQVRLGHLPHLGHIFGSQFKRFQVTSLYYGPHEPHLMKSILYYVGHVLWVAISGSHFVGRILGLNVV